MASSIYSHGKNLLPSPTVQDPNGLKSRKGQMGPLSKAAQVAPHHSLHSESTKLAKNSGNPAFKGEGNVFLSEQAKETCAHRSLNITPKNYEGTIVTPRVTETLIQIISK
jgi:hypothetical protein